MAGTAAAVSAMGMKEMKNSKKRVLVWRSESSRSFSRDEARACREKKLQLPDGYTEIAEEAFKNNIRLRNLILGQQVEEIGRNAFLNCTNLRSVEMPGIRKIGRGAFEGCTNFGKAVIPVSLEHLGRGAFAGCKRLQSVKIEENGVREIPADTFRECVSLTEITLPGQIREIEDRAFYRCRLLGQVRFPESVTKIGAESFYQCGLESLTLPESLEELGDSAFLKCRSLEYVRIPGNVRSLGKWLFHGCDRLKVLEIPHEPEHIGPWIINRSAKIRCQKGGSVEAYCRDAGFSYEYL